MKGAKGVLINLTCGEDTSLHDIDMAINRVREESDENANIIFGWSIDNNLEGIIKVSVVATGINRNEDQDEEQIQLNIMWLLTLKCIK